jgi:phosphatidylserine decarboxylase
MRIVHNFFVYIFYTINKDKTISRILSFIYKKVYGIDSNSSSIIDIFEREETVVAQSKFMSPCEGNIIYISDKLCTVSKGETINLNLQDAYNKYILINLYLTPKNLHNVYAPCDCTLLKVTDITGTHYPVFPWLTKIFPQIYRKNTKYIFEFDSDYGKFCIILIGSFLVGSVKVSSKTGFVKQAQKIGGFTFGSSVLLILPKNNLKKMQVGKNLHIGDNLYDN